jgi:hypothetical protein
MQISMNRDEANHRQDAPRTKCSPYGGRAKNPPFPENRLPQETRMVSQFEYLFVMAARRGGHPSGERLRAVKVFLAPADAGAMDGRFGDRP